MPRPHKVHLDKQIEYIADNTTGDRVSVIVQMESREDLRGYLEATTEAIAQRRSVATARALLPPPRKSLKTTARGNLTLASRRQLEQSPSNIAPTFLSSQTIRPKGDQLLRALGMRSLEPLLQSDWVRETIARAAGAQGQAAEPVHFASSGSAVVHLTKDELKELPTKVPNVADIYPNRTIRVPPVAKADPNELPTVVKDHKGYTWGLAKTGALASWSVFGTRGKDVLVAILDTGVDPAHDDLKGKIAGFAKFDKDGARGGKPLASATTEPGGPLQQPGRSPLLAGPSAAWYNVPCALGPGSSSVLCTVGGAAPPERLACRASQGRLFQPRCRPTWVINSSRPAATPPTVVLLELITQVGRRACEPSAPQVGW